MAFKAKQQSAKPDPKMKQCQQNTKHHATAAAIAAGAAATAIAANAAATAIAAAKSAPATSVSHHNNCCNRELQQNTNHCHSRQLTEQTTATTTAVNFLKKNVR